MYALSSMPYLIGVFLALGVPAFCRAIGFLSSAERERLFWAMILIVVAHYYILFGAIGMTTTGGSHEPLIYELIASCVFIAAAVLGFRTSMWIVALALAGHGVFDFFHARIIRDPGVPVWWPAFCMSFDVAAGVVMMVRLRTR